MAEITHLKISVIGYFRCQQVSPTESPRQGVLSNSSRGTVELLSSFAGDTLEDLLGMERIWLVYNFHQNSSWKPKVRPPRGADKKRGVFATRSPYRPNPIGISSVKLEGVEKNKIFVSEHDLLDGTPIIDIKPYLPYADSFAGAKIGWLESVEMFEVQFTKKVRQQLEWLGSQLGLDLLTLVENQLQYEPTNKKIKRVVKTSDGFEFSYKTWRVDFAVNESIVEVQNLRSGYCGAELKELIDPYEDKAIHRDFMLQQWD